MTTVIDSYTIGPLRLQILAATSSCADHPSVTVVAPNGWHILGGGAFVHWEDGVCTTPPAAGNLLTAMYPASATVWQANSKDHELVSPAQITGYCIAAQMQNGTSIPPGAYQIVSRDSAVANHPSITATLPAGWVLVGGGARANYGTGAGQLLYASVPGGNTSVRNGGNSWFAASKDHDVADPATVTAFAIGLTATFLAGAGLAVIYQSYSAPCATHWPWATLIVPGFHLSGGGAQDNWTGNGNLLTASFPQDRQTWRARGKDHVVSDPSTITAWGIGLVPA